MDSCKFCPPKLHSQGIWQGDRQGVSCASEVVRRKGSVLALVMGEGRKTGMRGQLRSGAGRKDRVSPGRWRCWRARREILRVSVTSPTHSRRAQRLAASSVAALTSGRVLRRAQAAWERRFDVWMSEGSKTQAHHTRVGAIEEQ